MHRSGDARSSARTPYATREGPDGPAGLRATIDLAPVGLAQLAPDGRVLLANDRFCALVGRRREALLDRPVAELAVADDRAACEALTARIARGARDGEALELRLRRADGAPALVRLALSAVRDADGAVGFLVCVAKDLAERSAIDEARREAQERLRVALEASRTGTFRWDIRTDAVAGDANLDRLFGVSAAPAARDFAAYVALIHPDDRPRVLAACRRCADAGVDFAEEFRVAWPDGSTHWIAARGCTFPGPDGAPSYMTGAGTDVTDRRSVEDELRASEARLRALVEASPLGIAIMDAEGAPVFYNPRCEELHGLTLREARDGGWARALHPDDREHVTRTWQQAARDGRPWAATYRFVHPDGQVVWISGRAAPMRVEGRPAGFVGTLEDITALKLAEQAARDSEAKLRRIIDSGVIGVFFATGAGTITDANDHFLDMLGYTREELEAGRLDWRALTPPEFHAIDEARRAAFATAGPTPPWEKAFYARDGREVPVLIAAARLEGAPRQGVAVCVDISERKAAEMERERLLTRERAALADAERAIRVRDDVLAIVAHDLRNPVHTIAMSAATMVELPLPEEQRVRQLGVIQRAARGMEHLIRDLLDVTRLESGTLPMERSRLHVLALLEETAELFEPQARERQIALSCEADPDLPPIAGDRDRLAQVLSNLIGNALKFTARGGAVRLAARRAGDAIEISVADTGAGIPPEQLPRIFDRFWQADRRSHAGAGLGLTIARGIVVAHGGRIWAESVPREGSTFHFTIPCAPRAPRPD